MERFAFNQWKWKKKTVAAGLLLHLLLSLAHLSSFYLFHLVHPGRPLSFAFKAATAHVHALFASSPSSSSSCVSPSPV
jgi:hypothetical protein